MKKIGYCKNCKHYEHNIANFLVCYNKYVDFDYDKRDDITEGIWTLSYEPDAVINVGPNFGCIHWEKKE